MNMGLLRPIADEIQPFGYSYDFRVKHVHKCTTKLVPTETQRSPLWHGKRRVSAESRMQSSKTITTPGNTANISDLRFWNPLCLRTSLKVQQLWKTTEQMCFIKVSQLRPVTGIPKFANHSQEFCFLCFLNKKKTKQQNNNCCLSLLHEKLLFGLNWSACEH